MTRSFSQRLFLLMVASISLIFCQPLAAQSHPATPSNGPAKSSIVYVNRKYGFRFDFPQSWKGYSILNQQWSGTTTSPDQPQRKEQGPRIVIRHPLWTRANPRQDIPILIFTLQQWREDLAVSAAPIGPSELGRNSRYVFALPPRYNFAFPEGFQEVEQIIQNKPLHPF